MLVVYVIGAIVVGAIAAVAFRSQMRVRRRKEAFAAMAERLGQAYDPSSFPTGAVLLVSPPGPPGEVAIDESGLHLRIGPSGLRFVPWSAIQSVMPVAGGRSAVRVSRVGAVVVPAALGRQIWDLAGREGAAKAERARAARV
ncbi:hypothetical protein [Rubrivirga marina]|uniref:Uncharacterized protein n=1 Tax=Rubrivirga marina TaxID=1196024 RepID=A0A271J0U2_9BACT|nr:hypothetical protein [Rubrivirga marina]PAP76927.1 hypothetical protein BSZ37_11035 [Rubrivirga marina]